MKFELRVPSIMEAENIKLQLIALYYGYELVIDDTKKRYMIISDEDVAYIQRHEQRGLFIIWRKTEYIQYLSDIMEVTDVLVKHDMILDDPKTFKQSLIKGLQNMIGWIPGVTLKQEIQRCR